MFRPTCDQRHLGRQQWSQYWLVSYLTLSDGHHSICRHPGVFDCVLGETSLLHLPSEWCCLSFLLSHNIQATVVTQRASTACSFRPHWQLTWCYFCVHEDAAVLKCTNSQQCGTLLSLELQPMSQRCILTTDISEVDEFECSKSYHEAAAFRENSDVLTVLI